MIKVTDVSKVTGLDPKILTISKNSLEWAGKMWKEASGEDHNPEMDGCVIIAESWSELPPLGHFEWLDWKPGADCWLGCKILSDGGEADIWVIPKAIADKAAIDDIKTYVLEGGNAFGPDGVPDVT